MAIYYHMYYNCVHVLLPVYKKQHTLLFHKVEKIGK